jgi:DNA-binding MltR family transcriptional regulator
MDTKDEFKKELIKLYDDGLSLLKQETIQNSVRKQNETGKKKKNVENDEDFSSIQVSYNKWYTVTLPLIRLLAQERYEDFADFYKSSKRKSNYYSTLEYTISDYLNNDREMLKGAFNNFDEFDTFSIKFQNQLAILNACIENIDALLFNIENVLQYNMYKSELEAATDLLRNGFIRPAGALAAVILEGYLKKICIKHGIKLNRKKPTMADYNEALRANGLIDTVLWRKIQYLGDIRNYCNHDKEREPRIDDVEDLISETGKITAMII